MRIRAIVMTLAGLFLLGSSLTGQKEDYVWILGYSNETVIPERPFGGVNLVFDDNKPVDTVYVPRSIDFDYANASICDANGNLLFYTNGEYVFNRNNQRMPNGGGLGEDNWQGSGNPLIQGFMALPFPGRDKQYLIIHSNWEYRRNANDKLYISVYNLKYTQVDMNMQNGLGVVTNKNVVISDKEHLWGGLTACRHANGRDWWVVKPAYHNQDSIGIETYLLSPEGINLFKTQLLSKVFSKNDYTVTSAVFSPDGSQFVISESFSINMPRYIRIFSFNRCTGELLINEVIEEVETGLENSVAISPNSRLLYHFTDSSIYQYDLYADTVANSKMRVAEYDGFVDIFGTQFSTPALAPDGKIYVNTPSTSSYLHVIENPDERGPACDVRQHAFILPAYNCRTMPNFPNFRLGKLEGSPCDSLVSSTQLPYSKLDFAVHPNPASDYLELDVHEPFTGRMELKITNAQGLEVWRHEYANHTKRIDLSHIPAGVYFMTLRTGDGKMGTTKLIIQR